MQAIEAGFAGAAPQGGGAPAMRRLLRAMRLLLDRLVPPRRSAELPPEFFRYPAV